MTALDLAADRSPGEHVLSTWIVRLQPAGRTGAPALDLLSRRGPVSSASAGPRAVVFDGVLHNRDALRRLLADPARDAEDAELVLKAYERWGVDMLDEIKGIFAVALWDGDRELGLLARDPLGIYPLFYTDREGELLVSTSSDALLEADGISATLNRAALADHLRHKWPDREETYHEAIRRVPACHALLIERGVRRLHRYWDPAPPGQDVDWIGEDELDQFHTLFDQAVNRCLALGPVGIFLSGGLDSVSVAGVAADNCRRQGAAEPLALSVAFPDPDCNEELAQRAVARDLGLDQIVLDLNHAVGSKGLLMTACEEQAGRPSPMINCYAPPYLQLASEAANRGYRSILSGNGGDEWLCVTPYYASDLIRSRNVSGLVRHVNSTRHSYNLPGWKVWHNALWTFGTKPILMGAAGAFLRARAPRVLTAYRRRMVRESIPPWVAPDPDLNEQVQQRGLEHWPEPASDGMYRHELRVGLDHRLVAMEMEENFENTRRTGARLLTPFFDADLVDYLYRVPPELLDRGGRSKGLVREELSRRFPNLGFERHKKISALGFYRKVALEQGARAWKELGGVPALAELGVVDAAQYEREFHQILAGREHDAFRIWDVLNLESWTRSRM